MLINQSREENKLLPVELGTNRAAQVHATDMLANDFLSHYGTDGLKSYMRYTLAGGTGYEGESIARVALHWSGEKGSAYQSYLVSMLEQAEKLMLQNPGDLSIILDKEYRHVNIGIAYNDNYLYLVQQFETNYVEFSGVPEIQDGILSLAARIESGIVPCQVQIYYDATPGILSSGQLSYAPYSIPGQPIALIRSMSGLPYQNDEKKIAWNSYPSPVTVPNNAEYMPAAEGIASFQWSVEHVGVIKYLQATTWEVQDQSFRLIADLSPVLEMFGPGVYTVVIWGISGTSLQTVSISGYTYHFAAPQVVLTTGSSIFLR